MTQVKKIKKIKAIDHIYANWSEVVTDQLQSCASRSTSKRMIAFVTENRSLST